MEMSVSRSRGKVARGALTAVLAASLAVMTACTSPSSDPTGSTSAGGTAPAVSDVGNPFGVVEGSQVEVLVLQGVADAPSWISYGADLAAEKFGLTVDLIESADVPTELQTRIAGGNTPDLGTPAYTLSELPLLEDLTDLWDSVGYDGVKISDAILPLAQKTGTLAGKFAYMPLTINQFSLYYSASLFAENGWTPPTTWDEMMALGEQAKAAGKYLFTWGKEAAGYWYEFALDCAVKQGGMDVWSNLANLKPGAYSDPNIVGCLEKIKETVDKGYWVPGGAGTQFVQAQTGWSLDQDSLFYFSGSWIEAEMADATAENFQMTAWPGPQLDPATAVLPFETVQMTNGTIMSVWSEGENPAAGREIIRAALSIEAATALAKATKQPSIVKGVVPADGWGSTALASIQRLAEASGDNAMPQLDTWTFPYGIDVSTSWNSFLSGDLTVDEMVAQLQSLSDRVAADTTIEKVEYVW